MQTKSNANVKGIDISHWQTVSDWGKVRDSGVQFVFAKSSEGSTYKDPAFADFVKGARSVNIPIGAYHYSRPSQTSAKAEAANFIAAMKAGFGDYGDLMPVLDLEEPSNGQGITGAALVQWARDFVSEVKAQTGKGVILYTGNWFITMYQISGLSDLPLWIANYSTTITAPPDGGGWTRWTAWQYTDKGNVPGISGISVDMNIAESLDALKGFVQYGEKSDRVKQLQTDLNTIGYNCGTADGIFGNATLSALNSFQTVWKLPVTGVLDEATQFAIKVALIPPPDPLANVPDWAKEAVKAGMKKGTITDPEGSNDFYRMVTMLHKLGLFV